MTLARSRPGRPRSSHPYRTPSGRILQRKDSVIQEITLVRRAERAGLSSSAITGRRGAQIAEALYKDQSLATAIGRLMWSHQSNGEKIRRQFTANDGTEQPVITDAMARAADVYRMTHDSWQRMNGLPTTALISSTAMLDTALQGRSTTEEASAGRQWHVATLLKRAHTALAQCPAPALVRCCVDDVVLLDTASPLLLERPAALAALRAGLLALAAIFGEADRPPPSHRRFSAEVAQTIRSARAEGLTFAAIKDRLTETFGDQAPSKTAIYQFLKQLEQGKKAPS